MALACEQQQPSACRGHPIVDVSTGTAMRLTKLVADASEYYHLPVPVLVPVFLALHLALRRQVSRLGRRFHTSSTPQATLFIQVRDRCPSTFRGDGAAFPVICKWVSVCSS